MSEEEKKDMLQIQFGEFEEEEGINQSQIEEIEELRKEAKVRIEGYLRKHFDKRSLEELTLAEGEELKRALQEHLKKKGARVINDYAIKPIENGFYEVRKKDGTVYTTHPKEGLCDCPDMRFRTKEACKHIEMIIENVPELKEEFEERKKVKTEAIEKKVVEFVPVDRWSVEEVLAKVSDDLIRKYYVYEFVQDGKTVTGLTADAITDMAHWMGSIETVDEHIMDAGDKYMGKVTVKDITRNFTVSGFAEESKWFLKGRPNKFAARIAFRKAQRNALSRLIPKFIAETLISRYEELKKEEKTE